MSEELEISQEQLDLVHPIALALIAHLDEGKRTDNVALTEEELDEMREALKVIYEHAELRPAVRSLFALSVYLGENGSPAAADQLDAVLAEEPLLEALKARKADADADEDDTKSKGEQDFKNFTGSKDEKVAPKPGEETPEDAVKIDKLDFPKFI